MKSKRTCVAVGKRRNGWWIIQRKGGTLLIPVGTSWPKARP